MRFIFLYTGCLFVPRLIAPPPRLHMRSDTRFTARLNIFFRFSDNGPMPWVSNWQEFAGLFRRPSTPR